MKFKPFVIVTILFLALSWIYGLFQASFEASLAVNQLQDSQIIYSLTQFVSGGKIQGLIFFVWISTMCVMALSLVKNKDAKNETK